MISAVGLIANPEAGRDIRRLVAHASVMDNMEKAHIVKRIIVTLQDLGVDKLIVMPETFGITQAALRMLPREPTLDIEFIDMRVLGDWRDTYYATKYMDGKVGSIISIGGDGTNRVIAKAEPKVPIMPISTGTNNVFPYMIEATIAAAAAAVVAKGVVGKEALFRAKRIEVLKNGELVDIALVDAVVTTHQFVGARALWKPEYIKEIVACLAAPYNIGLSSVPGMIKVITQDDDLGIYVKLFGGKPKEIINAPIAPGYFRRLRIYDVTELKLGQSVKVATKEGVIALDGEREVVFSEGDDIELRVSREGPYVINYREALRLASERGFFEVD